MLEGVDIDLPALRLDFDDAPDDEVADFRGVAAVQRGDGEKFVGFEDGAEGRGDDGGRGGRVEVRAVAAHPLGVGGDGFAGGDEGGGGGVGEVEVFVMGVVGV